MTNTASPSFLVACNVRLPALRCGNGQAGIHVARDLERLNRCVQSWTHLCPALQASFEYQPLRLGASFKPVDVCSLTKFHETFVKPLRDNKRHLNRLTLRRLGSSCR